MDAAIARSLFRYDSKTGVIERVAYTNGRKVRSIVSRPHSTKRLYVSVNKRNYIAHRVIWLMQTGDWPKGVIDHRNGDSLDNRWSNLRDVSRRVNSQNMRAARSSNAHGFMGVSQYRTVLKGVRWAAQIRIDGMPRHLGVFDTPEAAAAAYLAAKRKHHPGNTL